MINTSETTPNLEGQEEFRLFYLDSEISQLPEKDERRKVLEKFTAGRGVWRLADYLSGPRRGITREDFGIDDGKRLIEQGDFSGVIHGILWGKNSASDVAGKFFEEIALSSLEIKLPADLAVLPPDETEKKIREIETVPFSTIPDGLIVNNQGRIVGVAEYKLRASISGDEKRNQLEVLKEIEDKLSLEFGITYVVPNGGAQSLSIDKSEAKVVESPFTKKDSQRFLAAFLLDYLNYRQN